MLTLNFDVCIEKDVKTAIESIPVDFKKSIKILINNAGLAVGRGPIQDGSTDDWNRMIDTNIKGLLYVSHAVIPLLIQNTDFCEIILKNSRLHPLYL